MTNFIKNFDPQTLGPDVRLSMDQRWHPTPSCVEQTFKAPEAMMKFEPDWSFAPDWAQWFAVDANGCMYWYDGEPKIVDDVWEGDVYNSVGTIIINNWNGIKVYEDYPVWRESLRRRPQ